MTTKRRLVRLVDTQCYEFEAQQYYLMTEEQFSAIKALEKTYYYLNRAPQEQVDAILSQCEPAECPYEIVYQYC